MKKRALHSGPPPTPTHASKGRAQLGRVGEEPFTGTNKGSGAGLSRIRLLVLKSADLSKLPRLSDYVSIFTRKILIPLARIVGLNKTIQP